MGDGALAANVSGDELAVIVSALSGFGATVVTQYCLARKDRLALALQAKREQDDHDLKIAAARAQLTERSAELAMRYLITRQRELGTIEKLLREGADFEEMRRIAHNLKGTGSSYGYPDISRLGAALEKAALDHDLKEFSLQFDALAEHVRSIPAPSSIFDPADILL